MMRGKKGAAYSGSAYFELGGEFENFERGFANPTRRAGLRAL